MRDFFKRHSLIFGSLGGIVIVVWLSVSFIIGFYSDLFSCNKPQNKNFTTKSKKQPRVELISSGSTAIDKNGRLMEAETNGIYSVYNYKKVPQHGLYTDTKQTNDSTGSDVCSTVFMDGKLIHLICVVQPLTHYGDKRIWYYTNHDKN